MDELEIAKIRLRLGVQSPTVPGLPAAPLASDFVLPILATERVSKRFVPVQALGWVRRGGTNAVARRLLRSIHCELPPATKVKGLSIAEKQMVEIAKAISMRCVVLIMDEPTAVLSKPEVTALFQLIARLKNEAVA